MNRERPGVFRHSHQAMGTFFEVLIAGKGETYGRQVSATVFAEIDRLERLLSRYDPSSEISQINRLKPGESLRVGIETYDCLRVAARIQNETNGAFDINHRSLVEWKRNGVSRSRINNRELMESIGLSEIDGGYVAISPSEKAGEARVPLDLDLGGIGKGYALDKILDVLDDWSVGNALIHGGTSTALAVGQPPDAQNRRRGWPVGITSGCACREAPKKLWLNSRAVSGSGTEVKGQHIRDPRTGLPASGHLAAWASHPSAAIADALSTAFMVMSTAEVEAYCGRHPDVWAFVTIDSKNCRLFNPQAIDGTRQRRSCS